LSKLKPFSIHAHFSPSIRSLKILSPFTNNSGQKIQLFLLVAAKLWEGGKGRKGERVNYPDGSRNLLI